MDNDRYFEEFLHSFEERNGVDVTKDSDAYDIANIEFAEMEYWREEGFSRQEIYAYMADAYGYDSEDFNRWEGYGEDG